MAGMAEWFGDDLCHQSAAGTRQNDILLTRVEFFRSNGSRHTHIFVSSHYGFPTIALAIAPSARGPLFCIRIVGCAHLLPSRAATFPFIHHGAEYRGKQLHFSRNSLKPGVQLQNSFSRTLEENSFPSCV